MTHKIEEVAAEFLRPVIHALSQQLGQLGITGTVNVVTLLVLVAVVWPLTFGALVSNAVSQLFVLTYSLARGSPVPPELIRHEDASMLLLPFGLIAIISIGIVVIDHWFSPR